MWKELSNKGNKPGSAPQSRSCGQGKRRHGSSTFSRMSHGASLKKSYCQKATGQQCSENTKNGSSGYSCFNHKALKACIPSHTRRIFWRVLKNVEARNFTLLGPKQGCFNFSKGIKQRNTSKQESSNLAGASKIQDKYFQSYKTHQARTSTQNCVCQDAAEMILKSAFTAQLLARYGCKWTAHCSAEERTCKAKEKNGKQLFLKIHGISYE